LVLRFEKEGYQREEVALNRSFSGWIAAGVTAITLGVDLVTGSAYELPTQVQVTLKPLRGQLR